MFGELYSHSSAVIWKYSELEYVTLNRVAYVRPPVDRYRKSIQGVLSLLAIQVKVSRSDLLIQCSLQYLLPQHHLKTAETAIFRLPTRLSHHL